MTATDHKLTFASGCGFGLTAKIAMLEISLDEIGSERIERIRSALRAELHVPDEFWDLVRLPADPTTEILALSYLAIHAHLRQVVCWKAVRLDFKGEGSAGRLVYNLVLPFDSARLSKAVTEALLVWLAPGEEPEHTRLYTVLRDVGEVRKELPTRSITTGVLGFRALQLGYPLFLNEFGHLVVGQGAKRRIFRGLRTDRSSANAMNICSDKSGMAQRLAAWGLPSVPHRNAKTITAAIAAAEALGYPVVVKPRDQERGIGVYNNLRSPADVRQCFQLARKESAQIMIESHVEGRTHRLTVVEGEIVSVVRRTPGCVTGNGISTVAELVAAFNAEPTQVRRFLRDGRLPLSLDREALALLDQSGLTRTSVLAEGVFVALRRKDNVRAGGTNERIDIATVHPDNLEAAIFATHAVMLDIGGVDLIIPDITKSWRTQRCTICEVNGDPELGAWNVGYPFERILARTVGERVEDSRIRLTLYISASDHGQVRRPAVEEPAQWSCSASALMRGDQHLAGPFANGFAAARAALAHPEITELDIHLSAQEILRSGLPSDRFDKIIIGPLAARQAAAVRTLCRDHS